MYGIQLVLSSVTPKTFSISPSTALSTAMAGQDWGNSCLALVFPNMDLLTKKKLGFLPLNIDFTKTVALHLISQIPTERLQYVMKFIRRFGIMPISHRPLTICLCVERVAHTALPDALIHVLCVCVCDVHVHESGISMLCTSIRQ